MDEVATKLLEDVIAEVKENQVQPLSSRLQKRLLDYVSQPTQRAADGANACPECGSEWNQFVCGQCGYYETPRR